MADLLAFLSFGPEGWGDELLAGTWLTIRLAVSTLPLGLALGFLIALARRSNSRLLSGFGQLFTTIFRGLPELLTLFIVYYGGQLAVQWTANLLFDTYVEVSAFLAGMTALGLVYAAFASEVFLAAFRAIGHGQFESAEALGLRRWPMLRLVIAPQLIRLALPGLANLWLILLKDTALVSVIALDDLLRMTQVAVGVTREPFFFFLFACLIYLALSLISSVGIVAVERWAERGEARVAPRPFAEEAGR
ncbi:MAG TPA: ABC transporter permease subunit [Afifellaceae bacterium]|nr:ABC transporter permease subunit [Afifellaceae bacterium]